jgi:putative membrane protein
VLVEDDQYLDGAWHRLHPATPLLRGGIWFLAVVGWLVANFRERLVGAVFALPDEGGDPIDELSRHHLLTIAAVVVLVVLLVATALFWVSWRTSEFRIDGEAVTVRHGVLLRTQRTARLDRIQGVTISRPLFARLLGAARIEFDVAGQNANVRLEYLSGAAAERLRRDVLALAAGTRREAGEETPEAPADEGPAVRLLSIQPGRALGSVLLSETTAVLLGTAAVLIGTTVVLGEPVGTITLVPLLLAGITVSSRRVARNLRYTVLGTPDGVRIGSGLLSTNSEAVPPGRIHAIRIEQTVFWRPAGWWRVGVNRAGRLGGRRNADAERSLAPVASGEEVVALLPFLVPDLAPRLDLVRLGLTGRGGDGFVPAPRRARWLRPLAWRRTGFALAEGALLIRGGWLRRWLTIVPIARMQSVALTQGPASRLLRVAALHAHVVSGPVSTRVELIDEARARELFGELAAAGQHARRTDVAPPRSHGRDAASRRPGLPAPEGRVGPGDRGPGWAAPTGDPA